MLVLSRKVGQEIVIGTNIRLMVVAIKGEKVRLGIIAPKEVVVDRREIHEVRALFQGVASPYHSTNGESLSHFGAGR